jgi:hypothetical protein
MLVEMLVVQATMKSLILFLLDYGGTSVSIDMFDMFA